MEVLRNQCRIDVETRLEAVAQSPHVSFSAIVDRHTRRPIPVGSPHRGLAVIAATRAVLDSRPRLVFLLVTARAVAWFMAGHPVMVASGIGAWAFGASLLEASLLGLLVDGMLSVWSRRQASGLAQWPWLWAMACRFRRRWPVLFERANPQRLHFTGLLSRNRYNGSGGLRPVLASPLLSLTPVSIRGTTVEWTILTVATHGSGELAAAVEAVADFDSRLAKAQVHETSSPFGHGRLSITFVAPSERKS